MMSSLSCLDHSQRCPLLLISAFFTFSRGFDPPNPKSIPAIADMGQTLSKSKLGFKAIGYLMVAEEGEDYSK